MPKKKKSVCNTKERVRECSRTYDVFNLRFLKVGHFLSLFVFLYLCSLKANSYFTFFCFNSQLTNPKHVSPLILFFSRTPHAVPQLRG